MYMRRHTQSRDSIAVTRGKRVWGWAASRMSVGAAVAVSLHPAAAGPPELMEVIPSDAVVAYFLPGPDPAPLVDEPRSVLELAAFVADRAREVGLLANVDSSVRYWMDSLASLPEILAHAHAGALLDIQANARTDGGHELAELRAALVVRTHGANEDLEKRIQHLLKTYTNSEQTTLAARTSGAHTAYTLQDRRLPAWAEITWGSVGDYYVVSIGAGSFERMTETLADRSRSLAADPWVVQTASSAGDDEATFICHVRFERLRHHVDLALANKIEAVMRALRLGSVDRALWTFGRKDRAVEVNVALRRDGRNEVRRLVGHQFLGTLDHSPVPKDASGYAAMDGHPRSMFQGVCEAYLAAKSPAAGQSSRAFWRDLQASADVSIDRDLVARLTRPVVIHDFPRHALGLPFARTLLLRVDHEADALRESIDRLMRAARDRLSKTSVIGLERDPDGIWFASFGLAGPALAVTDRWVVISYSPQAVRQNLAFLGADGFAGPPK